MTDMTKPDLSRINAELAYERRQTAHLQTVIDRLNAENRALLDAKEAREAECRAAAELIQSLKAKVSEQDAQLTEAKASAAAAWEAAAVKVESDYEAHDQVCVSCCKSCAATIRIMAHDDHSATEALRRVKEAAWDDAYKRGLMSFGATNPYADKEAEHG